jgi:hypothetical protein
MKLNWSEKETHALAGGIAALEMLADHVATSPEPRTKAKGEAMRADAVILRDLLRSGL